MSARIGFARPDGPLSRSGTGAFAHAPIVARALLPSLVLAAAPAVLAATFDVDSTTDASDVSLGNGVCATAAAECTLRAAVEEANALAGADTINVPAGIYVSASASLDPTGDVTILGAGSASTIIDGGGVDRVIDASGATVSISGVTVRNGDSSSFAGAGIRAASDLILTDVVVTGNTTTGHGGGIMVEGGSASLTMTGCVVSGNSADRAAGINFKNTTGTLTLTDVTVSGNTGTDEGTGIRVFALNGTAALNRVTVDGNSGTQGAGVYFREVTTATVDNVTISGNMATGAGGGLLIDTGTVTLTNVTVTGNTAASGGGIRRGGGTLQLRNTIVAGNPAGSDCSGTVVSLGNNLDGDGTCGFGMTADPLLGPLQDNGGPTETQALPAGSPAIDAGTNVGCPPTDQRGLARPVDGDGNLSADCDVGAYESQTVPAAISGTVFEDVNYGGGAGRDRATAAADAPVFVIERAGVSVELYDGSGNHVAAASPQITDAAGAYTFSNLTPGTYTVRVVNDTVTSTRPGSNGSELGVQVYRADGVSEGVGAGARKVGGERPSNEDAAANSGVQTLASLQGTDVDTDGITEWTQSIVTVDASGGNVTGVDFGFNFDAVVNTNDSGQGSLRQFVLNSNVLTSADEIRPANTLATRS